LTPRRRWSYPGEIGMPPEDSITPVPTRVELLARIPLFSCFTAEEIEVLTTLFVDVAYRRHETICTAGEHGETFFILVSGELEVWSGDAVPRCINRLVAGDYFGEMSLLLGSTRSATVTVARNARLLSLDKAAFDRFFAQNAKVLEYFSRVLARQLGGMARGQEVRAGTLVIAVDAAPGLRGKTLVATALATLLADMTGREVLLARLQVAGREPGGDAPVALAELAREPADAVRRRLRTRAGDVPVLWIRPSRDADTDGEVEALSSVVTKLGEAFEYLVLDLPGTPGPLATAGVEVADVLVRIVDRTDGAIAPPVGTTRTYAVINGYNPSSPVIPINHCEPFVLPDDPALNDLASAEQALHVRSNAMAGVAPALHRLARKILGMTVGLALGGGAAFGLSHIGVFKVLEDNGIPIDLLAGSSMGSIVALGYAAGIRADRMLELARTNGTKLKTLSALLDVTLTRPGFLSGDRLVAIFAPMAEPVETFDQLVLPCRTVATDIQTGERVTIGTGRIADGFRASSAVPMLWAPLELDGRVLVDGGVADPVPADVVLEMGADICFAVNAVPRLKKDVQTVLARLYRSAKRFDPLTYIASGSRDLPNMFDVIMNSMQTLQYELGNFKAIAADVRINPDLSAYTWIEFYRPEEMIERGAEAAERALPEMKRVLAERLRANPRVASPVRAVAS
jgi:NTE family protein